MRDPFAAALDRLFYGPGSAAAVFVALAGGSPIDPIRVIRTRPDGMVKQGRVVVLPASNAFEIRIADVARPAIGDTIDIAGERFEISLDPVGDVEGLTWICAAEPMT